MDPGILVPPQGYGGHERLVYMFAREYSRLGHEVHLLVTEGSEVEGCTIHPIGKEGFPPKKWDARLAIPTAWKFIWKNRKKFDLIHNFGRLAYLLPVLNYPVKKIMTYGREISSNNIQTINKLPSKNLVFTGCSQNLISRVTAGGRWEVVYNAIDFSKYSIKTAVHADAPLIFLGRIEKVKGLHTAIKVVKLTGDKLIIAGNISPLKEEMAYFKNEIEPYINQEQITYVGSLNDEQKNYYLGISRALLFPIEWNEPFGMVMVEAMACGTPVIGFTMGSVNEVITDGITGFKVTSVEEMIFRSKETARMDRQNIRDHAESLFDIKVIAKQYLQLL